MDTAYELSGCSAQRCVSPRDVETYSYELTEHSLELPSFSVTARCKTTATGAVKAIPCTQDGDSVNRDAGKRGSPLVGGFFSRVGVGFRRSQKEDTWRTL